MTFTKQILARPRPDPRSCRTRPLRQYLSGHESGRPDDLDRDLGLQTRPARGTAAAVHVLTGEDIRRSGKDQHPEALRMVPGLMVGQNAASAWSISSRGRSSTPRSTTNSWS